MHPCQGIDMGKENSIKTGSPPVINGGADAKVKKRSFELKERCQDLAGDIYIVTSASPKEFRTTLCKRAQDYACEAIHHVRAANTYKIGTNTRKASQAQAVEMLNRVNDLLPVLTRCKCITPDQEKLLEKKIISLRINVERWIDKDNERLEEVKARMSS